MYKYLYRSAILAILCLFSFRASAQVVETPLEKHIRASYKIIQERRANTNLQGKDLYDQLTDTSTMKLPVGLGGSDNGKPPVIIDSIRFLKDHAEVTVFMLLTLPGSEEELMFAARGVPITRKGGLAGTARLELVNDKAMNLFGDSTAVVVKGGQTYVEFDCDGFKRLGLGAEISLSPKLVKENADGTQNLTERVKGAFQIQASNLNDIIASVSINPFQIRGMKGVTFSVQDAVVDLSDIQNSSGMVFPAEYSKIYGVADINLWRGFYLKSFTVTLPEEIKDRKTKGTRKSFAVRNALIDEKGFSGEITASYLLSLENGDMGGWAYSLEQLKLGFVANQFKEGSLGGRINVPISGDTTTFGYSAIFHPGVEYVFKVNPDKAVSFDIFQAADVQLTPSSFLEIALRKGNFVVAANLSGTLSIKGKVKGDNEKKDTTTSEGGDKSLLSIPSLKFEQLVISTEAPYFNAGTFALTGSVGFKLGGYGLSISNIKFVKDGDDRGIGFDVSLNLMGSSNSFAAEASLAVMGKVNVDDGGRHRYRYSGTKISRIALDIDQGPFALKGSLTFFNKDKIYGDGFRGDLDVKLKIANSSSGGFKMSAMALFGNVNDNRYWYADVLIEFPGAIPIFPPVMAKGFGGGLFYGVKKLDGKESAVGYELGTTPTGVSYKPDPDAGLGVKASVSFVLAQEKTANGSIGFEIEFYKTGGVRRLTFRGRVNAITVPMPGGLDKMKAMYPKLLANAAAADKAEGEAVQDASGQITISVLIDCDFENSTLYSNIKAYINAVGGALKGGGTDGLAGEGVFYAGPDGWFLHIGTPDNPINVEILGLAKANAYFMIGKDLPGSPPPPARVSEILGGMDLDYMRDLNSLGKGSGFAFGAGLDFDTGDLEFLMFYARLSAGLGFDIMLKNYGDQVRCEGKSGPIGVNGWYANGQVYAYFQGKIGINVKLPFKKGRFDIIELGAAVVLQAKLPNPAWMRGIVGGRFSILGGMVKGNCKFEVTLGKECKLVNQNLFAAAGVQVIADATPASNDAEVDIFTTPQVVFNMPVGENFNITDDLNKKHTFRARLEYCNVRSNGNNVVTDAVWNEDNTVVVMNPAQAMDEQTKYRVTAKVVFEEQVNGSWEPYKVDNEPYAEVIDHEFTTGDKPERIPDHRIAYTYPLRKQLNFYKSESKQGYIMFNQGLDVYFKPAADYKQIIRLTPEDGSAPTDFDFTYLSGKVSFSIPAAMVNSKAYKLQLVEVPTSVNNSADRNVTTVSNTTDAGDGSIAVSTKKAEGNLTEQVDKIFYELNFRSSNYNTFSEKVDAMGLGTSYRYPLSTGVHELGYQMINKESFDENEIDVNGNSKVLRFEAVLEDNPWYVEDIYPYVYEGYPVGGLRIDNRDTLLGLPPSRAIGIRQQAAGLVQEPGATAQYSGLSVFVYNLPNYMQRDYYDIMNKVANAIANKTLLVPTSAQQHILVTPFTPVRRGDYKFKIRYVLPGTEVQTSVKEITIVNTAGL